MLDPSSSKREDIVSNIQKTDIKPKEENKKPVVDPYLEPYSKIDGKKVCNFCAKKYHFIGPLVKHLKATHGIDEKVTQIVCVKCKKEFDTQEQLSRHKTIKTDCSK